MHAAEKIGTADTEEAGGRTPREKSTPEELATVGGGQCRRKHRGGGIGGPKEPQWSGMQGEGEGQGQGWPVGVGPPDG